MQKCRTDVSNFDKDFTTEEPTLTPIDPTVIRAINQDEFTGFTFVNDDFGKLSVFAPTINGSPETSEGPPPGGSQATPTRAPAPPLGQTMSPTKRGGPAGGGAAGGGEVKAEHVKLLKSQSSSPPAQASTAAPVSQTTPAAKSPAPSTASSPPANENPTSSRLAGSPANQDAKQPTSPAAIGGEGASQQSDASPTAQHQSETSAADPAQPIGPSSRSAPADAASTPGQPPEESSAC